jgi:hypothetical protein
MGIIGLLETLRVGYILKVKRLLKRIFRPKMEGEINRNPDLCSKEILCVDYCSNVTSHTMSVLLENFI